jgi:hypothetical protein
MSKRKRQSTIGPVESSAKSFAANEQGEPFTSVV